MIVYFSRKLLKKAKLEALSLDLTQPAYQEIISGIQDIDDPNNFFYGLAKLNKKNKSSGERYYITSEDLVKINKAYILDVSDLLSIGERKITSSQSDQHISTSQETKLTKSSSSDALKQNVPLKIKNIVVDTNSPISDTIFATKYTFMIRTVHFILENTQDISQFVRESFQNLKDLETLTLLLRSHSDDTVKKYLEILVKFMIIIPSSVNEYFCKIFPFVSLLIGSVQFLLRCLEIETLHFETEGENKQLIAEFCKMFTEWIHDKMDEIIRLRNNLNTERRSKIRKICTECQGFYFIFEE